VRLQTATKKDHATVNNVSPGWTLFEGHLSLISTGEIETDRLSGLIAGYPRHPHVPGEV
jgi:hypothetical protein